jgi:hypothetical protein
METESQLASPGPEHMRAAMSDYIRATHQAYIEASSHLPPADRQRLPLYSSNGFTVAAVGARNLHVIGTTEKLPNPQGHEVAITDQIGDVQWVVRFFDPTVIPHIGLIDESEGPAISRIQDALGIRSTLYHLIIPPGSGLSDHHAQHAGTGLAHSQAAASRDFDSLMALAPHKSELVIEMNSAYVNGLSNAHALLAQQIVPGLQLSTHEFNSVRTSLLRALRGKDG